MIECKVINETTTTNIDGDFEELACDIGRMLIGIYKSIHEINEDIAEALIEATHAMTDTDTFHQLKDLYLKDKKCDISGCLEIVNNEEDTNV